MEDESVVVDLRYCTYGMWLVVGREVQDLEAHTIKTGGGHVVPPFITRLPTRERATTLSRK